MGELSCSKALGLTARGIFNSPHPPLREMKPAIRLALTAAIEILNNIHVQRRVIAYLRYLRMNTK